MVMRMVVSVLLDHGADEAAFVLEELIALFGGQVLQVLSEIHESVVAVLEVLDFLLEVLCVSLVLQLFDLEFLEFLEAILVLSHQQTLFLFSLLHQLEELPLVLLHGFDLQVGLVELRLETTIIDLTGRGRTTFNVLHGRGRQRKNVGI